jgi:type I restriction enzyme R subunit
VASNKGCGKIIDYYGITKNLYASLNFDESIVESAMIDIDSLKKEFMVVLEEVMSMFSGVNIEDPSMPNLRKCLGIFADNEDRQQRFSEKYSRLKMLFEILSPDPFLKKYLRQFEWITSFYLAYLKEYVTEEKDINVLAQYGGKVKKLIQEKIDYEGITKTFKELTIHELATLEKMYAESDDQKAINLEKLLKREISINLDTNPIFKKFGERLVAIRNEFEKHQIDLAQRIKKYYELLGDIKKTNKEAGELGLNLKEYALYVISEEYIETGQEKILKEFIQEVRERVESILDFGWQESSKRDEFLKEIKRTLQVMALKEYKDRLKINDFPKYLNRLVDVIVKKF